MKIWFWSNGIILRHRKCRNNISSWINKFCKKYKSIWIWKQTQLNKRYKVVFNAINPDEIIQWKGSLLNKTLINLPLSLEEIALQLFRI